MGFPRQRPRRLRRTPGLRRMVRETALAVDDLVLPLFMREGKGERRPIASMPGCFQLSGDELLKQADRAARAGIPGVILFGIPGAKDEKGSGAYDPDGVVQRAVRALKARLSDLVVIADVCLCEYTDHGHCGAVVERPDGSREVDNDATLELLARTAVSLAAAGADVVAPSAMMDGQVGAIRAALDKAGHQAIAIMAYSAKYASAFYGPFRDAAESPPRFGDRRAYQMDPANAREALGEIALDVEEGADIVMVKPALAYLDIVRRAREAFDVPLAVYNVSGEYAMLKAAAANGWLDETQAMLEVLTGIKRAGADLILTYHALEAAAALAE
jgi:porphobilinogen synthase